MVLIQKIIINIFHSLIPPWGCGMCYLMFLLNIVLGLGFENLSFSTFPRGGTVHQQWSTSWA